MGNVFPRGCSLFLLLWNIVASRVIVKAKSLKCLHVENNPQQTKESCTVINSLLQSVVMDSMHFFFFCSFCSLDYVLSSFRFIKSVLFLWWGLCGSLYKGLWQRRVLLPLWHLEEHKCRIPLIHIKTDIRMQKT